MSTFSHLDVLSLPVSRQFEKVVLSNEVCLYFEHWRGNVPCAFKPGKADVFPAITSVSFSLSAKRSDSRKYVADYVLSNLDFMKH